MGPQDSARIEPKVHVLASGATLIITSPGHGFRFSDGTVAEPQHKEVCDRLTLTRTLRKVGAIKGMTVNEVKMILDVPGTWYLHELRRMADVVLVPFPVLQAIREQGIRHAYPNVLAFNATAETVRAAPGDKIVDVDNWSY